MVNYESLLLGGKVKRKVSQTTLDALARGRAVRAGNLEKKKKMEGKGQYNQDYVDESQINYAGSPLDMYYLGDSKDIEKERKERGEVGEHTERGEIGMGRRYGRGRGIEEELTSKAGARKVGGKLRKQKVKSPEASDVEEEDELEYTVGKLKKGGNMYFMKSQLHTGMDLPTESNFKQGGKVKRGHKKIDIEDLEGGSLNVDVPDAIRVLGELASKFGLKLVR